MLQAVIVLWETYLLGHMVEGAGYSSFVIQAPKQRAEGQPRCQGSDNAHVNVSQLYSLHVFY
jgi:hypothetical protein